jgi:hypothetical protein
VDPALRAERWRRSAAWRRLGALLLLGAASPAERPSRVEPLTVVACAPGYPGTTLEAQPGMDALAAAVARAADRPSTSLTGTYLPTEAEGVARLQRGSALALVPAPFYVKHRTDLALSARLAAVPAGLEGPTEVWTLVARKGRITSPAGLSGFTVLSIAGYAPGFVREVLAGWGALPPDARIEASSQVLSALRKAASGANVAVLLDGAQGAALATLPFAGELEVVARSAPVPAALVATVGLPTPEARWRPLERALLGLASAPDGSAALEGVRLQRFTPLPPGALEALARASRAGP